MKNRRQEVKQYWSVIKLIQPLAKKALETGAWQIAASIGSVEPDVSRLSSEEVDIVDKMDSYVRPRLPYSSNPLWQKFDYGPLERMLVELEYLDLVGFEFAYRIRPEYKHSMSDEGAKDFLSRIASFEVGKTPKADDDIAFLEREPEHLGSCVYECCTCCKCLLEETLGVDSIGFHGSEGRWMYNFGENGTVEQMLARPNVDNKLKVALEEYKKDPMSFFRNCDKPITNEEVGYV